MSNPATANGILSRPVLLGTACVAMLLTVFILPFHSVDEYSILKNTTSHLGAQNAPYAWVMNMVFVLLGATAIVEGWLRLGNYWLHKVILAVFGTSLIVTGVFRHAPIVPDVPFSTYEDGLHSLFASITGFSFTLFAIAAAAIEPTKVRRLVAMGAGAVAILVSILIFRMEDYAGIWQRLMFIVAFAWLLFFLGSRGRSSSRRPQPA